MATPYKPSWTHWILPAILGFFGAISIPMYFGKDPAEVVVPQSNLIFVEGVPSQIERDGIRGRFGKQTPVLRFKLAGYSTSYTGSNPKYREVAAAVYSGKSIRVGLAPKNTATPQFAELYSLSAKNQQVLNYTERAEQLGQAHSSLLIVGTALIGISAFGSFMNVRNSRRYSSINSVTSPE